MNFSAKMILIASFVFSVQSNASLVGVEGKEVVLDTSTGLGWMKLSETFNMSVDNVVSQMGEGGRFEGWSLALSEQVNAMMQMQFGALYRDGSNGNDVIAMEGSYAGPTQSIEIIASAPTGVASANEFGTLFGFTSGNYVGRRITYGLHASAEGAPSGHRVMTGVNTYFYDESMGPKSLTWGDATTMVYYNYYRDTFQASGTYEDDWSHPVYGVYLVQENYVAGAASTTSDIYSPALIFSWLFFIGLLGLTKTRYSQVS